MTTPIYLVRHAKAGSRARWTDPDHLRPLSKPGRRQAKALVGLFAEQPFSRLLSSPHIRCVETLEPLAAVRKLEVETTDDLAEGAAIEPVLDLMLALAQNWTGRTLHARRRDAALLVHRVASAGIPLQGGSPIDLAKGSTWIFDVADREFAQARYVLRPDV